MEYACKASKQKAKEKESRSIPVITFSVNLRSDGFLTPTIIRSDGRSWKQHRHIYLECGPTSDIGSTGYVEMGGTKVLALVTSLTPISHVYPFQTTTYLNFNVKLFRHFFSFKLHQKDIESEQKSIILNLTRALEPAIIQECMGHVKVNVEVVVIDHDGNPTSACIIASSLALFHCKIPMKDLVSSATLAVLPTGIILIDPTRNEKKLALPKEKLTEFLSKEEEVSFSSTLIKRKEGDISVRNNFPRVLEQMLEENNQKNETKGHPYGLFNLSFMPKCNKVSAISIYGDIQKDTYTELAPILKEQCVQIHGKMQKLLEEISQNKFRRRCQKIPEIYKDIKSLYADLC